MIEPQIYTLLTGITGLTDVVEDQIKPVTATVNSTSPHCFYSVAAQPRSMSLDGPTDLEQYTLDVILYSADLMLIDIALSSVKATLNGYRSGNFLLIAFQGESRNDEQDEAKSGTQNYAIWYKELGSTP